MAIKEICIASKAKLKLVAAGFVTLIQFYDAFGSAAIDDAVHQKDHIKHLSIGKDVTGLDAHFNYRLVPKHRKSISLCARKTNLATICGTTFLYVTQSSGSG